MDRTAANGMGDSVDKQRVERDIDFCAPVL